jgi:hypothetical protein
LAILFVSMVLAALGAACGDDGPSTPTSSTPATTRIIGVSGNLAFGEVPVGSSRDATITLSNTGNAALNVTGLSVSGGLSQFLTSSWTSGQIAAGGSQVITIRFAPTEAGTYSGTLTVNGDQTSGTNTLPISGSSVFSFAGNWRGGHRIAACNGTGSMQDLACSANRGEWPVGTLMIFEANLQQSGSAVTGTVNLGGLTGSVTGTVTSGVLTLQGTATGGDFTARITTWSTTIQGTNAMSGTVNYDLTYRGLPGVAGVESRLESVTK